MTGEAEVKDDSLHVSRYAIHLWDMNHEGVWENRAIYVYYAELIFELATLSIDFCHHLHMLVRTCIEVNSYLISGWY